MGGWFRKEIKTGRRSQGPEVPRRRICRHHPVQGSASCRSRSPAGDIYPALEKGTIDAAEWVGPYDDEKLGFVKVAQYYYYPGWWEGCGQGHNIINLAKWNELPKHYQAAITVASGDAWDWVLGKYDSANPPALQAPGRGRRAAARRSRRSHGGLLQGGERDLRRALRRPTRISRRCTTA